MKKRKRKRKEEEQRNERAYLFECLFAHVYVCVFPCGHLALTSCLSLVFPLCYFSPEDPRIEKNKENKANNNACHNTEDKASQGETDGKERRVIMVSALLPVISFNTFE